MPTQGERNKCGFCGGDITWFNALAFGQGGWRHEITPPGADKEHEPVPANLQAPMPVKWGDAQQYHAEPHANFQGEEHGVMPAVFLLWMTPDPLGAVAAMAEMYKGNVIHDLNEVTDDMRRQAFSDVQKTHLKAPLEAIKLHFLVEGVDRSFSHQHVRQRTAVYAQESMRFAVLGDLTEATTLPPSLQGTTHREPVDGDTAGIQQAQGWRTAWDNALDTVDAAYHLLVESGMPAEEARGLLPHATATRLHYVTDLRNLSDHAGNRLCTQAQFHWRMVFAQLISAIREYTPDFTWLGMGSHDEGYVTSLWDQKYRWQFEDLADAAKTNIFKPVCYQLNYCPFQASFDRACTIRERVEYKSRNGIPSSEWDQEQDLGIDFRKLTPWAKDRSPRSQEPHMINSIIPPIKTEEWLLNPGAARVR